MPAIGLELVGFLGDEGRVHPAISQNDRCRGLRQLVIEPGARFDLLVDERAAFGDDGIDQEEARSLLPRHTEPGDKMNLRGGGIPSPKNDSFTVLDVADVVAQEVPERADEAELGFTGAVVSLGAGGSAPKGDETFVEELEGAHRAVTAESEEGLRPVLFLEAQQLRRCVVDRVFPRNTLEALRDSPQRIEDAVLVVHPFRILRDLVTKESLRDGVIGIALQSN